MVEGLVLFESIYIFVENMLNLNQQRTMASNRGRKWEEKKKKREGATTKMTERFEDIMPKEETHASNALT